jgi:uncharacterized membrane protein YgcG
MKNNSPEWKKMVKKYQANKLQTPKKKGKAQPVAGTPARQNLNDKLDKVDEDESEAALGPNTPLGKLLASISDTMDTMNTMNRANNAPKPAEAQTLAVVTTISDAVDKAYLKRRIEQCPAITDMTAADPIHIIDWVRSQETYVKNNSSYSAALVGLAGTCDLSPNSPIKLIIEAAGMVKPFDHKAWIDTCKAIFLSASIPNIVQMMDARLDAVPARMPDENIALHFNRYNALLSRTQWLRTTLDKDTTDDWLRPCLNKWAAKLGNNQLTAATLRLGPGATLHEFYTAVLQAESTFGSHTELNKRVTRFNNIDEEPYEKSLADVIANLANTVKTGNRELQQGSRDLKARLLALEDRTEPARYDSGGRGNGYGRGRGGGRGGGPGRGRGGHYGGGDRHINPKYDRYDNHSPREPRDSRDLCYNCGKSGHVSADCKAPCKVCGSAAHSSATCDKRPKRGEKRKEPEAPPGAPPGNE